MNGAVFLALFILLGSCEENPDLNEDLSLTGSAFGTLYSIKVIGPNKYASTTLPAEVANILTAINSRYSTYDRNSLLSAFNQSSSTDWFTTSAELCAALERALSIAESTSGAFDPTVGQLVNTWGFGPDDMIFEPPSDGEVKQALESVGHGKLQTQCTENKIRKHHANLYVDLSGYAKGIAVDEIAALLNATGYLNYMVELGGEIRVRGHNPKGLPWRIAVERPNDHQRVPQSVLRISDVSLATSGDYRNFFEYEGTRYSHTIDPNTGHPVTHHTASVTVVDESAAFADAIATALLVLGQDDGLRFAESRDIAAMFIVRTDGEFQTVMTAGFQQYVE